jgi:hypothetical protein
VQYRVFLILPTSTIIASLRSATVEAGLKFAIYVHKTVSRIQTLLRMFL